MKKEYVVELNEKEADELMDEHWVGELVRCKDCIYAEEYLGRYTCYFDEENESGCKRSHNADWFCADGECKEGR